MLIPKTLTGGMVGFDTDTKLTECMACAMRAKGYAFAIRYLPIGPDPVPGDLDRKEMLAITSAGLILLAVQHVRFPGWRPTATLGMSDGQNAVTHALNAGLIADVTIANDLEGVQSPYVSQSIIDYLEAWYDQVRRPSYLPMQYVGANCGLTGEQLWDLSVTRYWKSLSEDVPNVPNRGYCMVQSYHAPEPMPDGSSLSIDYNVVNVDNLGGLPVGMIDDAAYQEAENLYAVE